jgi:hypothetical protein
VRKFKTSVFEKDAAWWFRWWNVSGEPPLLPLAQGLVGPYNDKQEAEAERHKFMDADKLKHPWVVFESA